MNNNKKIIISLGIIFSFVLLSISILKISINILYPGNELHNSLKDSFKDIFGKAIKFDTLYFKYNGDIILHNFYLSNTNDFNDNINLIKCQEITIDTFLFDLIRKKVTISGVYMVGPEVTILKNYGKTYYETFIDDMIGGIDKEKIDKFVTNGFRFELTDSNLSFRETFQNSKSDINFYNLDLKIKYKNNSITYRSYGNIQDKIRDSWFKSSYRVIGKIYLNKEFSEAEIKLENFDLTHLNNIVNDRLSSRTLFTGTFSGELEYSSENDNISCEGSTDTSSLNFYYYEKDIPYQLFKNENFDTSFKFNMSKKLDRLIIEKFEIDDGTLELSSFFDYLENDYLSVQLKSNKIDLKDLSESFYPFKNCNYSGEVSFDGVCKYNIKEKKPDNLNVNLTLNKFNIISLKENCSDLTNVKDCNISLSADKDKIILKTNFSAGKSDLNISSNSRILSWNPVKSTNSIEVFSKKMDDDLLKAILKNTISNVYNLAYVDMFQNFDEQRNFLKEPEGIFINDNDVSIKLHAEKLFIAGKSYLNNLNIDLSLTKGILKTNNFTLDGYNGIYNFNLYTSLNQEYPFFKFSAEAKDLDLNRISYDSGLDYSFGGKLSLDLNFETSAYRIGQVVENGKAGLNISVKDGYINNTPIQNKLSGFLTRNNYTGVFNRKIDFSNFSISFNQSANNFYIKNFAMNSANLSFNSYGIFTEEEGLKVPLNLNITNENKTDRVPLEISGYLETPCIQIKSTNKTKNESLCF